MKSIQQHIEQQLPGLRSHPFFQRLLGLPPLGEILPFARQLTFWVLTFQDVLQVNARQVVDPLFARIARHHLAEDAGHERWFLADVEAMDGTHASVNDLFGKSHAAVRHASFQLMAEVYRAGRIRR